MPEIAKLAIAAPPAAGLQPDETELLLLLLEDDSQLEAGCWAVVVVRPALLPAGGFIMAVTEAGMDNPVVWFMYVTTRRNSSSAFDCIMM